MEIGWIVFACIFGGALLGMFLRSRLPQHHLDTESKDLVKVGMGLIATMSALVLGLLVASAKNSFDTQRGELAQMAANVILLDRVLAHYGPETKECRELVRAFVVVTHGRFWPDEAPIQSNQSPFAFEVLIRQNSRTSRQRTRSQRTLQAQALKICIDVGQTRWLLFAQHAGSIPTPLPG